MVYHQCCDLFVNVWPKLFMSTQKILEGWVVTCLSFLEGYESIAFVLCLVNLMFGIYSQCVML